MEWFRAAMLNRENRRRHEIDSQKLAEKEHYRGRMCSCNPSMAIVWANMKPEDLIVRKQRTCSQTPCEHIHVQVHQVCDRQARVVHGMVVIIHPLCLSSNAQYTNQSYNSAAQPPLYEQHRQ